MTIISGWACDICRTEFREGDAGYSGKASLEIEIMFQTGVVSEYKFQDTCLNCRVNIDVAVQKEIENARNK